MRNLIVTLSIAAAITPADAKPKFHVTTEQFAFYRTLMEAKLAERFCAVDGMRINDPYFDNGSKEIPALSDKVATEIMSDVTKFHAEVKTDPAKWCDDYKAFLRGFSFSAEAPANFRGFGL